MSKHLKRDLGSLKKLLVEIGSLVENSVSDAIVALQNQDKALIEKILENEDAIDSLEVEIEEQCLKSLALHQPFAKDLRFITTVMKINSDLERMGDCAANIAKRARSLAKTELKEVPEEINQIADLVKKMVRNSLDCFINKDSELARTTVKQDVEVDTLHRATIQKLRLLMHQDEKFIDSSLDLITTCKRLERIADLSTNIAEDVIYLVDGEIVRHADDI